MLTPIADKLRALRLEVEEVGGTLNVVQGSGLMAHRVNVDPSPPRDLDESELRRWAAGYANAVKTVLLEPVRSKARHWSFVESTGSILPTIEARSFVEGVRDATGEDAWYEELPDDLVLAWTMRLDRGMRVVTRPQFEDWGVSRDRVVAAARSLLFHNTRESRWVEGDWPEPVRAIRVGDGYDAARILVVEDVFFSDVDKNWRFAMPEQDLLLAVASPDAADVLRSTAQARFEEAAYPLSPAVWRIQSGRPLPEST